MTSTLSPLLGRLAALLALLFALAAVPALAQSGAATVRGYVLGPNDAITVVVYGQQEFNVQTKVKPDGTISMPLIGTVQASGKTVVTLADEVKRRLESGNFLRNPIVNVEINEYNSRWVRVAGKVGAPSLVPLDRPYRLLDVLLRAGWVQDAGANAVVLRRAGETREQLIDVRDLGRGDPSKDLLLEAGDTIYLPEAELVYLQGQVNRPGAFPLRLGATVRSVLAAAGGVTQLGSANRFTLTRGGKEIEANADTPLQRDDVLTFRERLF